MKVNVKRITTAAVAVAITAGGLAACGSEDGSGAVVTKQHVSVHKGKDAAGEALPRAGRIAEAYRGGAAYSAGSAITSYYDDHVALRREPRSNPREHLAQRDVASSDEQHISTKLRRLLEDRP